MMAQRKNVTDRAHRYRANRMAPGGPRVCALCGSRDNLTVDHKNGKPDDTRPSNLQYLCKSCNTAKGFAFKKAKIGRLTNQYNPAKGGIPTFEQYMWAVTNHSRGEHDEGGAVIHATPVAKRREYASRIADVKGRRARAMDAERWNPANPWPFSSKLSARQTTPATGGIAFHSGRRKSAPAAKSKKKTESGFFSVPDEETLQKGFARGLSLSDMLRGNPSLAKLRKSNPAKFDRCVREVQAKGGAANAYAVCKSALKKNPAAASDAAFEEFHGYAPEETVRVKQDRHHHTHLAAAGDLVGLEVRPINGGPVRKIEGLGNALLTFNEKKNQLFVSGGDQRMSPAELKKFGITDEHELQTLGRVKGVGYFTNKTHLGDEGGEAVYSHKFRTTNKAGRHVVVTIAKEPDLIYRVLEEQFEFSGGSYVIRAEGIDL